MNNTRSLPKYLLFVLPAFALAACGGSGSGGTVMPKVEPAAAAPTPPAPTPEPDPAPATEWQLVWSDEFDGDRLNLDNWDIQEGDGSEVGLVRWGNNEEQWYTADNLTVADGTLTISARNEERMAGFPYTSGRIRTLDKFDFTYGRVEASIKAAPGKGLWSAFWMLSTNSPYDSWAAAGEIDIVEVINARTDAEKVFMTMHYGFVWPLAEQTGAPVDVIDAADGFHRYAVEWEADEIRWYLDGVNVFTVGKERYYSYFFADPMTGYTSAGESAPFDVDFHLLLNLAVGGNLPGTVEPGAVPSDMVIDYVRVYRCSAGNDDGSGCDFNADPSLDRPAAREPFEDSWPLYVDGATPLAWDLGTEQLSRELAINSFFDNGGNLVFMEIGDEDPNRGTVLEVITSGGGNISINAVDGAPTSLFGMGNNPNFWERYAAELKFDIRVDRAETDPESALLIKMDSGFPAVGYFELPVAELPADEWTTYSVKVNDLLTRSGDRPLDMNAIKSFFVFEPTSFASVRLDNIQLACGHPTPKGCGIHPPAREIGGESLAVFIDNVDPVWSNGIGAFDTRAGDYFNGTSANHVTWNIVPATESERGDVLRVNFGTGSENGLIYIQSASGVNLSQFAANGASLVFDLKLETDSNHSVIYKLDCGFPCSSGDKRLDLSDTTRGAWTRYVIPLSDFTDTGLDITRVNTGIVIFPVFGEQQGVSFELDNVRMEVPGDSNPGDFP